jgi:hypothetical protein
MIDWYMLLAPLSILAILLLFRFLGCKFTASDDPTTPPPTYNEIIIEEADLVAYWRLGEPAGTGSGAQAKDEKAANPGAYATAVLAEDPGQQSPAAPGALNLGAPGLIEGSPATSMQVNGGFVSVPFDAALNPPKTPGFTVEAWVVAQWDSGETGFFRSVIDSQGDGGAPSGYSLYAGPDPLNAADPKYYWQAYVGTGTELRFVRSSFPVALDQITYLVLTYDGTTETLTLYSADMEMDLNAMLTPPQITVSYSQNLTAPLFIGMGNPAGPSPLWPFQGRIQEVAIYKKALDAATIEKHGFAGLAV